MKINGIVRVEVRLKAVVARAVCHHLNEFLQIVVVGGACGQFPSFYGVPSACAVNSAHLQVIGVGALRACIRN